MDSTVVDTATQVALNVPKTFSHYPLYFQEIFGHTHPEIFLAYVTFSLLGALLFLFMKATMQAAALEPQKINMISLVKNKALRVITHLIVSIISMLIYIRFSPELVGMAASSAIAFGIGLCHELLLGGLWKFYLVIKNKIGVKNND